MFSVITASFRGARFLPRAYKSLLNQTGTHNIEWVIIDDFSNDGGETQSVIENLQKDAQIKIKTQYFDKNYYGSRSTYAGALMAEGNYSIILDQDDMLHEAALNIFSKHIKQYGSSANFAGVCGRCQRVDGTIIGTPFKFNKKLSNELAIRHQEKIRGEMFQCTKTNLLIDYFKELRPGFTNGWAWSRIARNYQYLYTSEVVRIYDTDNPQSHTNSKKIRNIAPQLEQLSGYVNENIEYLREDKIFLFNSTAQLVRLGRHLKIGFSDLRKMTPNIPFELLLLAYPVGLAKSIIDIKEGRISA